MKILPENRLSKNIRSLRIPTTQLYLFVVFIALFIMVMGVIGILRMHTIYRNAHTLYADRTLPLVQLTEIRIAYLDGILGTMERQEKGEITPKQALSNIHAAKDRIKENWTSYQLTYITPKEKIISDNVALQIGKLITQINAYEPLIQKASQTHQKELAEEAVRGQARLLLDSLNELIRLQVQIGTQLEEANTRLYDTTARQFFLSIGLSLLLIAIISFFLVRNIFKSIKGLEQHKQDLTEEQEKTKTFLDLAGDMIFIMHPDLSIAYVNQVTSKKLGYTQEELLAKKVYELFADTEFLSFRDAQNRIKQEGASVHERKFLKKDGSILYAESSVKVLPDGSYINIARDQTDKREVITALRESEEKYRYLFQNSPAYIIVWDLISMTVLEVNQAVINKYGYPAEDWQGMPVTRYRPKEDHARIQQFAAQMLKSREPIAKGNWRHLKYSGEEMWMEIVSHHISYKGIPAILSLGIDITEQVKMQEALQKSESLFHSLVDHAGEAIFMITRGGIIIDLNRKATEMFQYKKKELVGQNVLILHPPEAIQELPALWNKLKSDGSLTEERTFIRKDGTPVEVEISRNMLPDQSGAIAILRDISVRKKYETQQKLFASIVNNSDDAIISKSLSSIITSWNKGAETMLGYSAFEAIGQHISMIFPEDLYEEEEEIIGQIKRGNSVDHLETRRRRKDGTVIYVSATISPLIDPAGNMTGASTILRDITEKVRAEELIRQSEANYRQLFDESPVAMWVADPETLQFIQVNKACITQYGYSREEFTQLQLTNIIPGIRQQIERSAPHKNLSAAGIFSFESEHFKKDGAILDVVTSAIPVTLTGAREWLMIAMDITEKNRFEQQLTRAAIKVQEQERYEIGGELHDNVCQILATCLIYLDMMKKNLAKEDYSLYERTRSFINLASTETRNLSHQLAPVFMEESDIEDVFKRLLNNFNLQNKYKIILRVDQLYKAVPLNNELQLNLYRILQEQLRNIYKHAEATVITVTVSGTDQVLEMTIADNGKGFDPGSMKGGIGIANMKRRAKVFNGTFLLHSSPGNGCKIYIQVPLAKI